MFACSVCGDNGACYCECVDEDGGPAGDYLHPFCATRRAIEEGNKREPRLYSRLYSGPRNGPARRLSGIGSPDGKRASVHKLRVSLGSLAQRIPGPLRRL